MIKFRVTFRKQTQESILDFSVQYALLDDTELDFKEECLKRIHHYIQKLTVTIDALDKREKDFDAIQMRLALALKLAKKYEHLLTATQQEQVNLRIPEDPMKEDEDDQLTLKVPDEIEKPPKDPTVLKFYQSLSNDKKQKFDNLHRKIFYNTFAKYKEEIIRNYTVNKEDASLPKRPEFLLFNDKENFESMIASRVALLALEEQFADIDDESLNSWRMTALLHLEIEQQLFLRNEQVVKKEI